MTDSDDTERLELFSHGVMAIAVTALAVETNIEGGGWGPSKFSGKPQVRSGILAASGSGGDESPEQTSQKGQTGPMAFQIHLSNADTCCGLASTYASIDHVPKREDLLAELAKNPKSVSLDFLDKVLKAFDYQAKPGKGSHRVYRKPGQYPITVPYRRPHVKQFYVKEVIARLRSELPQQSGGEKGDSDGRD